MKRKIRRYKKKFKQAFKRNMSLLAVALVSFGLILLTIHYRPLQTAISFDSQERQVKLEEKHQFIQAILPSALMAYQEYGVLPSIIMGQAILESDWGQSDLAQEANNLFGIKGSQPGQNFTTQEYIDGQWHTVQAEFKVYSSWEESIAEHSRLLASGPDWDPSLYQEVQSARDYKTAAYALQEAGYATDPNYAQKLIDLIEREGLAEYDPKP